MNTKVTENYGGNCVLTLPINEKGITEFVDCSYMYYQDLLVPFESVVVDGLKSYTVFLPNIYESGTVTIVDTGATLYPGDSAQVENQNIVVRANNQNVRVFVSGIKSSIRDGVDIRICRTGEHYKVIKPWGHELWLNKEHPGYSFKEIFIKAGKRTSLQYHNLKEETNLLMDGVVRLIYQAGETHQYLGDIVLNPISSIHVVPKSLHRLEAIEDTVLYETSTPHLDDVIRVDDDTHRSDGRIKSEHEKS